MFGLCAFWDNKGPSQHSVWQPTWTRAYSSGSLMTAGSRSSFPSSSSSSSDSSSSGSCGGTVSPKLATQRLRQTAADLEDKALQCEGIHCDDEQRSNGSPAPAVLTLAESEISQHHARSERNGDFTSPTSLVTRSKTLFGANSRLAAGQIPKCVGLDLPLRRIKSHCRRGWWRPVTGLLAHTEYGTVSTVFEPFRV
jgi:hypothetical protein